ncbi:MAG: Ig-like domain-containing protein [Thermoplasmatota archaeon]
MRLGERYAHRLRGKAVSPTGTRRLEPSRWSPPAPSGACRGSLVATLVLFSVLTFLPAPAHAAGGVCIGAQTTLAFSNPSAWSFGVGTTSNIAGSLVESPNGNAVVGAPVTISINNVVMQPTLYTDTYGDFLASFKFQAAGTYTIAAAFSPPRGSTASWACDTPSSTSTRTTVIAASFQLPNAISLYREAALTKGSTIAGAVEVNGAGSAGDTVSFTLDNLTIGHQSTDSRGNFSFAFTLPAPAMPGPHTARFSTTVPNGNSRPFSFSQTVVVDVLTVAELTDVRPLQTVWPAGLPINFTFSFRDNTSYPLSIRSVFVSMKSVSTGNELGHTVGTNATGVASGYLSAKGTTTGFVTGSYNLTCLDAHVPDIQVLPGPVEHITVAAVNVAWVGPEPVVRRGQTAQAAVVLELDSTNVTTWRPNFSDITSSVYPQVASNPYGSTWPVVLTAGSAELQGTTNIQVNILSPAGSVGVGTLSWRIVSQPTLNVLSHSTVAGKPGSVVIHALDETKLPVAGLSLRVSLTASKGGWHRNATGTTDLGGNFTWQFDTAGMPSSPLLLSASAAGTTSSLAAFTNQTFQTQSVAAFGFAQTAPWALGIVALAATGGGAYWVVRKKNAPVATVTPAAAVATAHLVGAGETPDVSLSISDIEEGLPPVWGAGTPFTLVIRAQRPPARPNRLPQSSAEGVTVPPRPEPLAGANVIMDSPAGRREITLDAAGEATVAGLVGPEGDFRINISIAPSAKNGAAEVSMTLRLVDYEREIGREFDSLVERATLLSPKLGRQTTPRELEAALEEKLPRDMAGPLNDIASSVERANYAPTDVSRAEYVTLVRGRLAIDPLLPAGGPPANAGKGRRVGKAPVKSVAPTASVAPGKGSGGPP